MAPSAWIAVLAFAALFALGLWLRRVSPAARPLEEDSQDPAEPGVIAIEDSIDLHGFQPREIPDVVMSYLEAASERGLSEVRLIHGRGKGVQRQRVQSLLREHPRVKGFGDAPQHLGGWGATIVVLEPLAQSPGGASAANDPDETPV